MFLCMIMDLFTSFPCIMSIDLGLKTGETETGHCTNRLTYNWLSDFLGSMYYNPEKDRKVKSF